MDGLVVSTDELHVLKSFLETKKTSSVGMPGGTSMFLLMFSRFCLWSLF